MPKHSHTAAPSLAEGVAAVDREAGGMLALDVVLSSEFLELFAIAAAGGGRAGRLACAVVDTLSKVAHAPPEAPALCAACPNAIRRPPFSVVIATPNRDDPTRAIGLVICAACATTRDGVGDKAISALREIWPESRAIELQQHAAGRA